MVSIRKSLSTKLSLSILLLAVPIFVVSLGVLFTQSRHIIRREAVGRANSVLSTTMQRVCLRLATVETATDANSWLVTEQLQPDALLALSKRIVALNSYVDGCSISAEPDLFPEYGRYFSVYTIRDERGITGVVEEQYEYFTKIWYTTPREQGKACWVSYYDESDSLEITLDGLIASYGRPIYNADGNLVAVISSDISLKRLSQIIAAEKPYPKSYFMMVDSEGRYFIHPDSTRLFEQTIFSNTNPRTQADIIALGHEMTNGKTGQMVAVIDGEESLVCYQPVPGTSWSLALVCPDSDILHGYHQLTYIIAPLLFFGLIVILVLCHRTVAHAIRPIGQLLVKTQEIASGNMEVHIPTSHRMDAVGRLQNSFATMLRHLQFHMGSVRYTSEQAKRRNEELAKAIRQAEEADRQKAVFIQNVTHQIRTPLNIIMGFVQVLSDTMTNGEAALSEEEKKSIIATMDHNAKLLNRMVMMLFDSSDSGLSEEILAAGKYDVVSCNYLAREAISYVNQHYPDVNVKFSSNVGDDFSIETNSLYLMRSLREILYNSAKCSDGEHVSLSVVVGDAATGSDRKPAVSPPTVRFIVEDTGKGIEEADLDRLFTFFAKVDDLSEGLGLGLPLAKRHARNLGGDLTLDTSYHGGCRFIIEIPIAKKRI